MWGLLMVTGKISPFLFTPMNLSSRLDAPVFFPRYRNSLSPYPSINPNH